MGLLSSIGKVASVVTGLGQAASAVKGFSEPSVSEQSKEFAQNRLQWMVEDAQKAGIHPLAALGMGSPSPAFSTDNQFDRIAEMGQGISRAVDSFATSEDRDLLRKSAVLDLENKSLQNDRLRSEIALMQQPGTPPGFALSPVIAGQGDAVNPELKVPAEHTAHSSAAANIEGGSYPEIAYVHDSPTTLRIVPSAMQKQRMEDDIVEQLRYHTRHNMPVVSQIRRFIKEPPYPREVPLPRGYKRWLWVGDRWRASKR